MSDRCLKENDYVEFRDNDSKHLIGKVILVSNLPNTTSRAGDLKFIEGENQIYQITSDQIISIFPDPIPLEFYRIAKKFLALVEDSSITNNEKLLKTEQTLGDTISKIISLDDNCIKGMSDEYEENPLSYSEVREIVASKYSGIGLYQSLFGNINLTEEVSSDNISVGDAIDDITDIYLDLFHGCFLFEKRKFADAAFHWKESFKNHWGKHSTELLLYIHEIAFVNKLEDQKTSAIKAYS